MSVMRPNCKDCDRLIPKPVGEAGERPAYYQTTMYDHFENFQNFQKAKEERETVKKRWEKVLRFDPNFTNFQLQDESQTDLSRFSAPNSEKFRKHLRLNLSNFLPDQNTAVRIDKPQTILVCRDEPDESSQPNSLRLLMGRSPMTCPLSNCNQTITTTTMLSHFLRDHNEEYGVQYKETFMGKPSTLIFDINNLEYDNINCLGILTYGGRKNQKGGYPGERGICMHNAFLSKPYEKFYAHLPVLIMCYRTTWAAIITKGMFKEVNEQPRKPKSDLLVIWLATVQTTEDIYGTITLYNREMSTSISSIVKLRCITNVQDPKEFISEETDFLRLGYYDINELSHNLTEYIHADIMINEYTIENLQKSHAQHQRMLLYRHRQHTRMMQDKNTLHKWLQAIENPNYPNQTNSNSNSNSNTSNNKQPDKKDSKHKQTDASDLKQLYVGKNQQNTEQNASVKAKDNYNILKMFNRHQRKAATVAGSKNKVKGTDQHVRHYEHPDGAYAILEAEQNGGKKIIKLRLTDKEVLDDKYKPPHDDVVSLKKCSKEYRSLIKNSLRNKIRRTLAIKRYLKQQRQQQRPQLPQPNMEIKNDSKHPNESKPCPANGQHTNTANKIRRNQHSKKKCQPQNEDNPSKQMAATNENKATNKQQANLQKEEKVHLKVEQAIQEYQLPDIEQYECNDSRTYVLKKKTNSNKKPSHKTNDFHKAEHEIKPNIINKENKNVNYCKRDIKSTARQEGNNSNKTPADFHQIPDDRKHSERHGNHFIQPEQVSVERSDAEGNLGGRHADREKEKDNKAVDQSQNPQYNNDKLPIKLQLKELLEKIHAKYSGCEKQKRVMDKRIQKIIQELESKHIKLKPPCSPNQLPDNRNCKVEGNSLANQTEYKQHMEARYSNHNRASRNECSRNQNSCDEYGRGAKSFNGHIPCRKSSDNSRSSRRCSSESCRPLRKCSRERRTQEGPKIKMNQTNDNYERHIVGCEICERHGESLERRERIERREKNEKADKYQSGDNFEGQYRSRRQTRVQNEQRSTKRTKSLDVHPLSAHQNRIESLRRKHYLDLKHSSSSQNLQNNNIDREMAPIIGMSYNRHNNPYDNRDLKYIKSPKPEDLNEGTSNNSFRSVCQVCHENDNQKIKESNFKLDCSTQMSNDNIRINMKRLQSDQSRQKIHLIEQMNSGLYKIDQQYNGLLTYNEHHDTLNSDGITDDNNESGPCITSDSSAERIIDKKYDKLMTPYSPHNSFGKKNFPVSGNYPAKLCTNNEREGDGFKADHTELNRINIKANDRQKVVDTDIRNILVSNDETDNDETCYGYVSTPLYSDTDNSYQCRNIIHSSELETDSSAANLRYSHDEDDDYDGDDDNENGQHNVEINTILKSVYANIPELSE